MIHFCIHAFLWYSYNVKIRNKRVFNILLFQFTTRIPHYYFLKKIFISVFFEGFICLHTITYIGENSEEHFNN